MAVFNRLRRARRSDMAVFFRTISSVELRSVLSAPWTFSAITAGITGRAPTDILLIYVFRPIFKTTQNGPRQRSELMPLLGFVIMFHGYDNISLFVPCFDIPVSLGSLCQRIASIYDRL